MVKQLTNEHRRRISESIKLQHKTRDNYAMNGKKHNKETKIKMSLASKGHPKSKQHIKHWSDSMNRLRTNGELKQWNKGLTPRKGKYTPVYKISHKIYTSQPNNFYRVPRGMVIHHLDLNANNNNPSNLMMLDWSSHAKLHNQICKEMRNKEVKL